MADTAKEPTALSFDTLRLANVARLPHFKDSHGRPAHLKPDGSDWSLGEWACAVLGELGEAANIIKKINRGDLTLDMPSDKRALADELADTLIYLDILAFRAGIDLGQAVVAKWNRTSERVGYEGRISAAGFAIPYGFTDREVVEASGGQT